MHLNGHILLDIETNFKCYFSTEVLNSPPATCQLQGVYMAVEGRPEGGRHAIIVRCVQILFRGLLQQIQVPVNRSFVVPRHCLYISYNFLKKKTTLNNILEVLEGVRHVQVNCGSTGERVAVRAALGRKPNCCRAVPAINGKQSPVSA